MAPPHRFAESAIPSFGADPMIDNDLAPWDYHALRDALALARPGGLVHGESHHARRARRLRWTGPLRESRPATSRSSETGWTSRRGSPWPTNTSMPCTGMVSASGIDAGPSGRCRSPFRFQNHSTDHQLEGPDDGDPRSANCSKNCWTRSGRRKRYAATAPSCCRRFIGVGSGNAPATPNWMPFSWRQSPTRPSVAHRRHRPRPNCPRSRVMKSWRSWAAAAWASSTRPGTCAWTAWSP